MQMQADLLQAPVEVYPSPHATALGVAAFARLGNRRRPTRRHRRVATRRRVRAAHRRRRSGGAPAALAPRRRGDDGSACMKGLSVRGRRRVEGRACGARQAWPDASTLEQMVRHRRPLRRRRSSAPASSAPRSRASSRSTGCVACCSTRPATSAAGTSKANTAILHTGFDAKPGTLEARLVRRGHALLSAYGAERRHPDRAHRRAAGGVGRRAARRPAPASPTTRRATATPRRTPAQRGGALRARAASRSRRARRAAHSRREPDLPVHHAARVRHPGGGQRRRAARSTVALQSVRAAEPDGDLHVLRHLARAVLRALRRQRRRAVRRRSRPAASATRAFTVTPRRGELIVFDKLARPLLQPHRAAGAQPASPRACWSARPCSATSSSARPPRTSPTSAPPARPPPAWRACARRAGAFCRRCSRRR